MRILVIEDDPEIARYLRKGLSEAGHTVEHADNGRDGLYLATGESFDAIVLDRLLPQMDGLTVLTALRATGAAIPVLILSALSQVDDRIKGLRAGGDEDRLRDEAGALGGLDEEAAVVLLLHLRDRLAQVEGGGHQPGTAQQHRQHRAGDEAACDRDRHGDGICRRWRRSDWH